MTKSKDRKLAEEAMRILNRMINHDDPCRYDYHGYRQNHNLHERPCPHEEAKRLFEKEGIKW